MRVSGRFAWGMRRKTLSRDLPVAWVVSTATEEAHVAADLCRLALFSPVLLPGPFPESQLTRVADSGVVLLDTTVSEVPPELSRLRRVNVAFGTPRRGPAWTPVGSAPSDRDWEEPTTSRLWADRPPTRAEVRRQREKTGAHPRPSAHLGSGVREHVPADVTIPGQETELLRLLVELNPGAEEVARGDNRVILVGAWHGGGGATATALALARSSGAILADAAGNHGGWVPVDEALDWGDLDPGDLPAAARLVAALPRQGDVPTLGPDDSTPVRPDQEVVASVVAAVPGRAVVDCGTNLVAMNQLASDLEQAGKEVSIVVTGRASEHGVSCLAAACATNAVSGPVLYLLRGRKGPLFGPVVQRFGLRWQKLPPLHAIRRWNSLQESLWAA